MRGEVRDLRQDVKRLIKLLEKEEDGEDESAAASEPLEKSAAEKRIVQQLDHPVSLHFEKTPLDEALKQLSKTADINIVLDSVGLQEEGLNSGTPITLDVEGIKIKSALSLMLAPLNLAYTIEDEVLKVTSATRAGGPLIAMTYPVADLVVPLPSLSRQARAQSAVDFHTLITLITNTVEPESWDEVGGSGSIKPFETTLSLVIRQTREGHEQIADLLGQMRRLQDLQVTIETRWLTVREQDWKELAGYKNWAVLSRLSAERKYVALSAPQEKQLVDLFQRNPRTNSSQEPKVTLFNGQLAPVLGDPFTGGEQALNLSATVSGDRRWVRVHVGESPLKELVSARVADGNPLLIDMSHLMTPDATHKERLLLFLTPKVIVQEEEEELIGIDLENDPVPREKWE